MFRNIAPFERLGRYFVAYQARLNFKLSLAAADDDYYHIYDDLSNLISGFSALPKWLQVPMFAEFADYIVSDLLVRVRGKSLCSLWSEPFFFFLKKGFFSPLYT